MSPVHSSLAWQQAGIWDPPSVQYNHTTVNQALNKSITYGFDIQNHVFSKTKGKGGSNSNVAIDSLASQCSKKTKTPQSPSSSNSAASSREKITIFYPQEQPVALTFPPLWQEACTVFLTSIPTPRSAQPAPLPTQSQVAMFWCGFWCQQQRTVQTGTDSTAASLLLLLFSSALAGAPKPEFCLHYFPFQPATYTFVDIKINKAHFEKCHLSWWH